MLPIVARCRTHVDQHDAVVQPGSRCRSERQLGGKQPLRGRGQAASHPRSHPYGPNLLSTHNGRSMEPSLSRRRAFGLFQGYVVARNDALRGTEPERLCSFYRDAERAAQLQERPRRRTFVGRGWPHRAGLRTHERGPKVRDERNHNAVKGGRQEADTVASTVEHRAAASAAGDGAFNSEAGSREASRTCTCPFARRRSVLTQP